MGFPRRPRLRPTQGSSSSSTEQSSQRSQSDRQPSSKRLKVAKDEPIFDHDETKAFIVVAKLSSEELGALNRSIVRNGGQVVSSYEEATLVIANTRLWGRLNKYLPGYDQEPKQIAHISWIEDSLAAGHQMPLNDKYLIHKPMDVLAAQRASRSVSPSSVPGTPGSAGPSQPNLLHTVLSHSLGQQVAPVRNNEPGGTERATPPKWRNRRFACQRWHPLVCVNQALLLELCWIRDYNRLEGEERRSATYARAMAAIKSYPYPIKSAKEAGAILGVGEKIASQCEEFVKTGKIAAAEIIKRNERSAVLVEFTKIHGVGPSTARDLYDKYNCRTLADVQKIAHKLPTMGDMSIMYVEEFDQRIPRDEVEWMASIVNDELQKVIPGAEYTIVGGYRRGKPTSGDVDIIFTHPEPNREKGALEELLKRLEKANLVTEVLYLALTDSQRDHTMKHFHASHMDPLDKAFIVFLSPANGTTRLKPIHRRLDLIFAPRKYYACAILGWSGSTTFERDLRMYAEKYKGLKFDSGGLFRRSNSEEILVDTEKEIFDVLGLEYIPPEWRNCDL